MNKKEIKFTENNSSRGGNISRRSLLVAGSTGAMALAAPPIWAKDEVSWPSKAIRLVVTAPAGGVSDIIARVLADQMAIDLKQPVVVENIGGGGGSIGSRAVLSAPSDGHTLMLTTNAVLVEVPYVVKLPYVPVQEFTQVADLVHLPLVLVGNPNVVPAKNYDELFSLLKASPNKFSVANLGVGTRGHNATVIFNRQTGLNLQPVSYKGSTPAVTDLLAGHVPLAFEAIPNVINHLRSGKLKLYAVGTADRLKMFPDVPSFSEKGISDISELASAQGVWISSATPRALAERVHKAVIKSFAASKARQQFSDKGYEFTVPTSLEEQNKELVAAFNRTGEIFKSYSIQTN